MLRIRDKPRFYFSDRQVSFLVDLVFFDCTPILLNSTTIHMFQKPENFLIFQRRRVPLKLFIDLFA